MRRSLVVLVSLALLIPAAAVAKGKPGEPGAKGRSPEVMYVLRGTLTAYVPASGAGNGSVTIMVKAANHHGASLTGKTMTFAVSAQTKIVGAFTANDDGLVKLRGRKAGLGDHSTFGTLVAKQVIDQSAPSQTD